MLIQIRRVAILILCLMILLPSCVREVDLSTAYQKKVVVYCVIHTYGGKAGVPNPPGLAPSYSIYEGYSDTQRLYMYYNSSTGGKEYLPDDAKAYLWEDERNELLAEFVRVSDEEWDTKYLPSYKKLADDVNEYSIHLRLEIDIPGEETIVARTRLDRQINVKTWRMHHGLFGYYNIQEKDFVGPVWFLPEAWAYKHTYISHEEGSGVFDYLNHVHIRSLRSNYAYADSFNYSGEVFLYGIRVLPDNQGGDHHYSMAIGEKPSPQQIGERQSIGYDTRINLTYVSDEYDRFLRDAIIYRIRHDNENDPLKHLYEDQIYSNIEGGVGLFGAEVMVYPPDVLFDD